MSSIPPPSYASMGPELSLESTKEQHNGIGYRKFMELYQEYKAGTKTKRDLMRLMNIGSYNTINKFLGLVSKEAKKQLNKPHNQEKDR